jgi:hypothetical protein
LLFAFVSAFDHLFEFLSLFLFFFSFLIGYQMCVLSMHSSRGRLIACVV